MRPRPGLIVVVPVPLLPGSAEPNPVLSLGEAPLVGFSDWIAAGRQAMTTIRTG